MSSSNIRNLTVKENISTNASNRYHDVNYSSENSIRFPSLPKKTDQSNVIDESDIQTEFCSSASRPIKKNNKAVPIPAFSKSKIEQFGMLQGNREQQA